MILTPSNLTVHRSALRRRFIALFTLISWGLVPTAAAWQGNAVPRGSEDGKGIAGVTTIRLHGARDWMSTGLQLRAGEAVRIKAWGRIRLATAGGMLVDPMGADLPGVARLMDGARAAQLIAVIGDDNNDYIAAGRESDFKSPRAGMLYLTLNQDDPSGNTGDFEIRVTVGNSRGMSFGRGDDVMAQANSGTPRPPSPDAPTGTATSKTVTVSARLDWTNTYLTVERGDTIIVESTGTIGLDLAGKTCGPDGIATMKDPARLLLDKPTGAVVAVIGVDNNDFFFLGASGRFKATRNGLLFLGVNEGDLTNNAGSFTSRVRIEKAASGK